MVFKLINISKGKRADIAVKALSVFWLAVVMDKVLSEVMDEGEIIIAHGADTVFLAKRPLCWTFTFVCSYRCGGFFTGCRQQDMASTRSATAMT